MIKIVGNLLFYAKNFIFKNSSTPKELRRFTCFICGGRFLFPITAKDYMACNVCLETLKDE